MSVCVVACVFELNVIMHQCVIIVITVIAMKTDSDAEMINKLTIMWTFEVVTLFEV